MKIHEVLNILGLRLDVYMRDSKHKKTVVSLTLILLKLHIGWHT